MLRDIFTNKWILGGIGFLILIAGGCLFWYEYTISQYEKAAAETEEYARQWEKDRQAKPKAAADPETASPQTPADSNTPTADKQRTNVNPVTDKSSQTQAGNPAQNAETADVRVSPHGLGPYPEVPADYPIPPDEFNWDFWGETLKGELMSRVRIKLWNQGIRSEGASFENGKVYPTILGTVYVKWSENGDFIRRITGHPDDDFDAISEALESGQPPPEGITVLNRNEAGIDPYTFLELNQKE